MLRVMIYVIITCYHQV